MKPGTHSSVLITLLLLFCSFFLVICKRASEDEAVAPEPELAEHMGSLQQFAHKVALSVAAENRESADFYLHELEEVTEVIQKEVPQYEGHDITGLMNSMFEPHLEGVEASLETDSWQDTRSKLITLIDACNSCHHATDHGFIEIIPGFDTNPYNQAF